MTFLEKLQVIERLDQLIRLRATGSPKELALRLNISRSTLYNIINCMNCMNAEICYNKREKHFFYKKEKVFSIGFLDKNTLDPK